jgi:ADP-ribosyl-[dinitrogen reductase] hydrolase
LAKNKKFRKFNKSTNDRNWNWRDANHIYSPCRFKQQPGYIGSYCMDALAMALHTVYFSKSFSEVVIRNADMGGDCDTVGSIAGQIAGAIYGVDEGMLNLYS